MIPNFETAHPRAILKWAVESYGGRGLVVVTSFGPAGMVIVHLLSEIAPDLPVIFLDTLYHFPETLAHVERVRRRYGLDLRIWRPAPGRTVFEAQHGDRLWQRDADRYHQLTKVRPLAQALDGVAAWVNGRRRDQSSARASVQPVEVGDRVKITPLAAWSRTDVWRFITEHDVPYNPLHDQGYPSIGDAPLTTPVLPGEDERAGRWRGTTRTECGIHSLT